MAKYKINVNSIAPCIFWTPLTAPILMTKKCTRSLCPEFPGQSGRTRGFHRSSGISFLEASEFITGDILYVDEEALPVDSKDKRIWTEERLRIFQSSQWNDGARDCAGFRSQNYNVVLLDVQQELLSRRLMASVRTSLSWLNEGWQEKRDRAHPSENQDNVRFKGSPFWNSICHRKLFLKIWL